jgi:hypothetical protein
MAGLNAYLKIKNNSLINYPIQPVYNIKKKLNFAFYTPLIFNFKLTILNYKNSSKFVFIYDNKKLTFVLYIVNIKIFFEKSSSLIFFTNIFDNNIYKYSGKAYRIIKKKKTL